MRRFLPSRRTRKNIQSPNALRDEFIRELTLEANTLIKQLSEQFGQTLQSHLTQAYQGIVPGDNSATPAITGDGPGTIGSIGQLLSTGVRYLISRPRTSRRTRDTARSLENETPFRVSRAQSLAQTQEALGQGQRNL
jgi:hypothetical protein